MQIPPPLAPGGPNPKFVAYINQLRAAILERLPNENSPPGMLRSITTKGSIDIPLTKPSPTATSSSLPVWL